MNIALVVYAYYSRDARVKKYAEYLVKNGFKVDCICLKEDIKNNKKDISFIYFPFVRRRLGKVWYFIEYLSFFLFTSWTLLKLNPSKKYRVIHINNIPDILVFTGLIPKLFGAKIILDMHDPMPELYMAKYSKNITDVSIKALLFIEYICLHFADHIITANNTFKSIFAQRTHIQKKKISVILNCPDPKVFLQRKKNMNQKKFTIFYMGTIEKRFNLDLVLNTIPKLIEKIPNLRFTIVPKLKEEGAYMRLLNKKIKDENLSQYINLETPKTNIEIAHMLRSADIGIALYEKSIYTDSLFSVKLLEYVQMGIPVITTKTKTISLYFSDTQLLYLYKNTEEEFLNAVIKLFQQPQLRESLAINAQKYLKEYNWNKEKMKYLKILYSIMPNEYI